MEAFRVPIAVLFFGLPLLSVSFILYALVTGDRARLRWQVPGAAANLAFAAGLALVLLGSGALQWAGAAPTLAGSAVSAWLLWAEHRWSKSPDESLGQTPPPAPVG